MSFKIERGINKSDTSIKSYFIWQRLGCVHVAAGKKKLPNKSLLIADIQCNEETGIFLNNVLFICISEVLGML